MITFPKCSVIKLLLRRAYTNWNTEFSRLVDFGQLFHNIIVEAVEGNK